MSNSITYRRFEFDRASLSHSRQRYILALEVWPMKLWQFLSDVGILVASVIGVLITLAALTGF
jgi:hypothetical protein